MHTAAEVAAVLDVTGPGICAARKSAFVVPVGHAVAPNAAVAATERTPFTSEGDSTAEPKQYDPAGQGEGAPPAAVPLAM